LSSTAIPNSKPKFELKMGVATREAYGQALVELGKANPNVVVLDADLAKSTFSVKFQKEFPERFFTVCVVVRGVSLRQRL
jgi:transketolase C-terminal domain/subunit